MINVNLGFFVSARSEYGLLRWLIKEVVESEHITPIIYIGGGMLSSIFGLAINEIIAEFSNSVTIVKLPYLLDITDESSLSKSMGVGIISLSQRISEDSLNTFVILGDRYDTIIPSTVATINNIPILHIAGGDITEGVIDNQIRHSLTKLSHIHLPQTFHAAEIISSLGEEDWRIVIAGAPGIENIKRLYLPNKEEIFSEFAIDLYKPTFLCTYHPVTLENLINTKEQISQLITVLQGFLSTYQIVITYPGVESKSNEIICHLKEFANSKENVFLFDNLGSKNYLGIMRYCKCVIGNSSSGIIEAPSLNIPTVNIGSRQKGRIASKSVVHCDCSCKEIEEALKIALSEKHKYICQTQNNPYESQSDEFFSKITLRVITKMINNRNDILKKKLSFEVKKNEWNSLLLD